MTSPSKLKHRHLPRSWSFSPVTSRGIVALLQPGWDHWSGEDWQAYFDERAGIAEFDGGLPRPDAEARAFACCVEEWLNRSFARSPPGRRFPRGDGDLLHDTGRSHRIGPTEHVWLHSRCWPAWHPGRKAAAVAALAAMGIALPLKFPDDFGKNGNP
jgi:hypothetical protein